jgi:flagellar motor protein MotB
MKNILLSGFLFFYIHIFSQNMIPNPSFEQHGHMYRAVCTTEEFSTVVTNWEGLGHLPPHQVYFTKDYTPNQDEIEKIDYNFNKYAPHTGRSMVRLWSHSGVSERPPHPLGHGGLLYTNLTSPIKAGKCYKISYWYYIQPKTGAVLDTLFSKQFGITLLENKPKLIKDKSPLRASNTPLNHNKIPYIVGEWQKVSYYVVTENDFKSIALGVFIIPEVGYKFMPSGGLYFYYFVDDVEVSEVKTITPSIRDSTIYYPNPLDQKQKKGANEVIFNTKIIYFDTGISTIKDTAFALLDSIGLSMKKQRNLCINIIGNTDNIGADTANIALSVQRANAVSNYLVEKFGIAPFRLKIGGNGAQQNGTPKNDWTQRKVEISKSELSTAQKAYRRAVALINETKPDSAILYLRIWLSLEHENRILALVDPDFDPLKKHPAWEKITNEVIKSYSEYKKPMMCYELDKLYFNDQKYRSNGSDYFLPLRGNIPPSISFDSIDRYRTLVNIQDSLNLLNLRKLTNELQDIPSPTEISERALSSIYYILVHNDDWELRKRYMSRLEGYCLNYKRFCPEYAMLFDRIMNHETGFQKYGSIMMPDPNDPKKLIYVPFKDKKSVNSDRKAINLGFIDLDRF